MENFRWTDAVTLTVRVKTKKKVKKKNQLNMYLDQGFKNWYGERIEK